jgi:hypothetical protein
MIEEDAQAEGLGALGGDQAALAADVVAAVKELDLSLIEVGIAFQARGAFFESATKTGADVEAFFARGSGIGIVKHGAHLVVD